MFCFLSYWCWQDCWRCEVDTDLLSVHRLSGQSRRTEMLVVTALTSRPARGFQNCPALSVFFLFPPARVLGCPGLSWCLPWRQATPSNTLGHSHSHTEPSVQCEILRWSCRAQEDRQTESDWCCLKCVLCPALVGGCPMVELRATPRSTSPGQHSPDMALKLVRHQPLVLPGATTDIVTKLLWMFHLLISRHFINVGWVSSVRRSRAFHARHLDSGSKLMTF